MMYRMLAAAIAAATLAPGLALAQTGATGGTPQPGMSQPGGTNLDIDSLKPVSEYDTAVTYNGTLTGNLRTDVKGANGETIGHVDKVLADHTDKVLAVTMKPGGAGGKEVVVPIDRLQYDPNTKVFTTKLSKDDVTSLPEWRR
jgi:PRC-barrel domain